MEAIDCVDKNVTVMCGCC